MEFRPARLAAMALIALLAACQVPTPKEASDGPHRGAPLREAPSNLEDANAQLAALAEPVRTERALQWARYYLVNQRAQDASDLLDRIADSAQSQDQRYRWLWLRAQCWLALQKPERALELLDGSRSTIDGLDAQRRARLKLLHADALALDGQLMDSVSERVAVDALLDRDDQRYSRKLTWEALMSLPMDTLENRSEQASGDLRGWLELALLYRDPQADIDNQVQRLSQWREQWPNHPAALQLPEMVGAMRKAARQRPQRVAVLLPESGNLSTAADAIRDGMMTGYYSAEEAGNPTPDLRFYDVSNADVSAVFQRAVEDGAQFVVGPLAKEQVAELAAQGAPPVTVLALNYLDQGSRDAPLFQFGLAPEDEARQVARQAWREGHRQVGVLYPESDWGRRVSGAFMNAWRERGGEVSLESGFTDENMGDTVRNLMEAARERQGGPTKDRYGRKTEYQPRIGEDMSFLFMVASPNQGRQIKPLLNFHYGRRLPVYTTSYIYDGTPAPRRDQDLDGVRFVDMPWILYQDTRLHRLAEETWPEGHGRYNRLFAMGVDAYRLQARLSMLRSLSGAELPGVTGNLHLEGARLVRDGNWAVFRRGEPEPLPRISGRRAGEPVRD
ncbi:penicillin-binding protein activator [Alloalcanivorax profundimaris]|uniref:penicillin-binding protein activator n=1 Tax=Alloalcanivorax profundimaris TaxID=2735259 RepID=UPI001889933E|nr:penicillin-binding protein activator [Alloalcanivorax profundimaris]MBF1800737.1 ABC transporter substrate-binding protein [Alloalcanivorax profundimaris]